MKRKIIVTILSCFLFVNIALAEKLTTSTDKMEQLINLLDRFELEIAIRAESGKFVSPMAIRKQAEEKRLSIFEALETYENLDLVQIEADLKKEFNLDYIRTQQDIDDYTHKKNELESGLSQLSENDKRILTDLKEKLEHPSYEKESVISDDTAKAIAKGLAIAFGLWIANFLRKKKNNES